MCSYILINIMMANNVITVSHPVGGRLAKATVAASKLILK